MAVNEKEIAHFSARQQTIVIWKSVQSCSNSKAKLIMFLSITNVYSEDRYITSWQSVDLLLAYVNDMPS